MDGELRTAISRGRGLEAGRFSCRTALPTDLVAVGPQGPLVGLTLAMVAERDPQRCDYAITLVGIVLLAIAGGIIIASVLGFPTLFAT